MTVKNRAAIRTSTRSSGIGLEWRELSAPEPGHVQVEVELCGLCGSDLHIWRGDDGYEWVEVGRTLGHEVVGKIAVADQHLGQGDRVVLIAQSGCGECASCRADNANGCAEKLTIGLSREGGAANFVNVPARQVIKVPDHLPSRTAVLAEPLSVAARAVARRGGVGAADVVAVSGPGTIGILAALVCRHLGAEVHLLGTAGDLATRSDLARRLGLELSVGLPDGVVPQVWFEASGAAPALDCAITSLPVSGRLVLLALYPKPPVWDVNRAVRKELDIISSYSSHRPDYELALRILAEHPELGRSLVEVHPLEDIAAALDRIGTGRAPKIAVAPAL